jgi:hypothetical protein
LAAGDIVSARVDDHSNPVVDPKIFSMNLNIVRIGW